MDAPFPEGMVEEIERILSGEHSSDVVFASPLMFPLQRKSELREMLRIAGEPRVVMEIGADKGGGLYHWCMIPTVRRVIACEVRGTPYAAAFERAFPHISFLWLPCSSYDDATVKIVRQWLGSDLIDVLFIDGDKSMFIKDFDCYRDLVRHVTFMHDVQDFAPREAFELARIGYRSERIVHTDDWKAVGEPRTAHDAWLVHWKGRSCGVGVLYA